jgi:hypothetical protein
VRWAEEDPNPGVKRREAEHTRVRLHQSMLQREGAQMQAGTPLYQLPLLNHHANGQTTDAYPATDTQYGAPSSLQPQQPPTNPSTANASHQLHQQQTYPDPTAYPATNHQFEPVPVLHASAGYRVGPPSSAAQHALGMSLQPPPGPPPQHVTGEVEVDHGAEGEPGGAGLLGADYGDSEHDSDSENQYF